MRRHQRTSLAVLYWRSPHWSDEAGYIFEIAPNSQARERLFKENRLVRLTGAEAEAIKAACASSCPTWVAPRALDRYDVWGHADDPRSHFRVLVDKDSGTLFLSDYQR
jgi:hypothetical protein